MKIKNDSVMIKVGNKQFDFTNLILNTYLKQMINAIDDNDIFKGHAPNLEICYIRFMRSDSVNETNDFQFDEDSILNTSDFDVAINRNSVNLQTSNNFVILNMQYSVQDNLDSYVGNMVTHLGFADSYGKFYACVDVSSAGIYIQPNEDFTVFRRDILSTNAYFTTNNEKVNYPLHLVSFDNKSVLNAGTSEYPYLEKKIFAKLRSYGFGYSKNIIQDEYDIIMTIGEVEFLDTSIIINVENNETEGLYPADDLFPANFVYLEKSNYTYIFLKFKVYEIVYKIDSSYNKVYSTVDTGIYYTLSMPIHRGQFQYRLKYERG